MTREPTTAVFLPMTHTEQGVSNLLIPKTHYQLGAPLMLRDGDIVISTRSKSGTTWLQMICALLVFQTPDLPAPLGELSPWLDWLALTPGCARS